MLYPIMPIFLNSVLGAPAAIIGAIEGAAEGAMALTKLVSSKLNRWLPRKSMVLLGYGGAALGKIIIAAALIWPIVMTGRVVDRLGKGMRSAARDAILVQGVTTADRGKVIGFHRTSDTTGAVIGPLLALALLSFFDGAIRPILWIAVVPAILSTAAVLFIKDADPETRKSQKVAKSEAKSPHHKLSSKLNTLIWILAVLSISNFPDALILLHLSQDKLSVTTVVGLYLVFNIAYATFSFPAGMLGDKFKSKTIYSLGLICFAIAYGGLALTSDLTSATILMIIYGGFAAANDVVGKSWASKLAGDHQQLQVQAKLQGLTGFGILFAGIWAGLAWNLGAGTGIVPMLISASIATVAALVIARLKLNA